MGVNVLTSEDYGKSAAFDLVAPFVDDAQDAENGYPSAMALLAALQEDHAITSAALNSLNQITESTAGNAQQGTADASGRSQVHSYQYYDTLYRKPFIWKWKKISEVAMYIRDYLRYSPQMQEELFGELIMNARHELEDIIQVTRMVQELAPEGTLSEEEGKG